MTASRRSLSFFLAKLRKTGPSPWLLLMGGALAVSWPRSTVDDERTSAVVVEAPFVESLVERGTLTAARMLQYGSTIAGAQAKLVEIVPEGTAVAPGEVLFRFDAAPFEEAVARETVALAEAEAELVRAQEDLRLETMRAEAEVSAAREQMSAAEAELASEREGRAPLAIAEAEVAANEAARELERARTAAADMHALLQKGFVTRLEADRADQQLRQADDRARLATLRLRTLREYEQPAAIDRSRAGVAAARKGLESAAEVARARLAQRRAALRLVEGRAHEARQRLRSAQDRVARTTVRATTAGLVVYREMFFGTDRRKPQPGDEVWSNQPLVAVPDSSQFVVEARVREIDLHKVASSQQVTVTVDAYPDLSLPATVASIGALAQGDPSRAGARFFPITVALARTDPRLRTGMTARLDIRVSSIDRALVVPVDAVIEDGGVARCYVITRRGREARTVRVAARNELVAAIAEGLTAGERVWLAGR